MIVWICFFAIIESNDSIWGLDFPFSVPAAALVKLGFESRKEMIEAVCKMTRKQFAKFVADRMNDYPRRCHDGDIQYCRHTDNAVQAHSVFKTVNPNLRVMLYAGLKMLKYLADCGINIYPLGNFDSTFPTVCEIYPSHTWKKIGMKRSTDVDTFLERFNSQNILFVECDFDTELVNNQDLADSVVACVTIATAYLNQNMACGWDCRLPIFTEQEWKQRQVEGLIVRF